MTCMWNVIDSTNETRKFEFPTDTASLASLETGFRSKSRSQVLKGLGAIDSVRFPMSNPGNSIDHPQRHFVQIQGKFSLFHLACCESDCKFAFLIVQNRLKHRILWRFMELK